MKFPAVTLEVTRLIPWSERRRRGLPEEHPGRETVTCTATLEIDVESLTKSLAQRALGNKSRKSGEAGGLVTCTIRPALSPQSGETR